MVLIMRNEYDGSQTCYFMHVTGLAPPLQPLIEPLSLLSSTIFLCGIIIIGLYYTDNIQNIVTRVQPSLLQKLL